MLGTKKILIGVTGGIAAYKTCEIIRSFIKANAQVRVVMTDAARAFVTPLTYETLTNYPVHCGLFEKSTIHIELARWADCIVICPATANSIGKIAHGIADNLLTTLVLAANVPVLFCPAMNKEMYLNPIFKANAEILRQHGYQFVAPGEGELACGEYGWGRLADEQLIFDEVKKVLLTNRALQGKKVLVTASRTEEPFDPVRIITNYSSGKMGFAIAENAVLCGADVTLISGPTALKSFSGVTYLPVQTARQMRDALFDHWDDTDILIMSAAVSDFRPRLVNPNKIKKQFETMSIELERTEDILLEAGGKKGNRILIGFALETENEIEQATEKLKKKNLDLIVLNNPMESGAGFRADTNRVTLIKKNGDIEKLPLMYKYQVSKKIIDTIIEIVNERNSRKI